MIFERSDRKYELLKGSDIIRDTVYLELNDVTDGEPKTVLFGEKTEAGEYRFLSLEHLRTEAVEPILLPLDLVEDFIIWMKERL